MSWTVPRQLSERLSHDVEKRDRTRELPQVLYRFVKQKHFDCSRDWAVRNFSGVRHQFNSAGRFTPASGLFGFFFGSTRKVATAEMVYHCWKAAGRSLEDLPWSVTKRETREVLGLIRELTGESYVFLEVYQSTFGELLNFTSPQVVAAFCHHGNANIRRRCEYWVDYLVSLVTPVASRDLTDVLALDAFHSGYSGIVFPSTRALMFDGELPPHCMYRLDLWSLLTDRGNGVYSLPSVVLQAAEGFFHAEQQLKQDYNVVVYDDNRLIESLTDLVWVSETDDGHCSIQDSETGEDVEQVRLRIRRALSMSPEMAAENGLLSRHERLDEFHCGYFMTR